MNRILILTAAFGEGHNAAARGIRDALSRLAPAAEVELHDLFAETYGRLNDLVRRSYLGLINKWPRAWGSVYRWLDCKQNFDRDFKWFAPVKRRFGDLLARFQPDVVVSVFPAYPYLLHQILGSGRSCRSVVVVTDSITVNAIWYRCAADYYIVPNEQSAAVVRAAGIAPETIRAFGFPVSPRFADLPHARTAPSAATGRRVLYMINAGTAQAAEVVRRLTEMELDLTVTIGRDEKLRKIIQAAASPRRPVEIIGWTDGLPELLTRSHLLIGKAGGATVQEAIAAGCPMIINHVVSGQEEGNAQLILETKSGARAHSPADVANLVQGAFADDAKQWREWATNIAQLSRPRASLDVAEFLASL